MENKSDTRLRKMLKNWANRQSPPDNVRARLLWEVAHIPRNRFDDSIFLFHPQFRPYPTSYSSDWTQALFAWVNENSFQVGLKARLI